MGKRLLPSPGRERNCPTLRHLPFPTFAQKREGGTGRKGRQKKEMMEWGDH